MSRSRFAQPPLLGGHAVHLLEGGQAYFPALIEAIDQAQHEVRLETYIFDFTGAGADVAHALIRAARRKVSVMVVVDGFGAAPLTPEWQQRLHAAGVAWRVYFAPGLLDLILPGRWRRLHRKLCVVDSAVAFCGGINVLDDFHDPNHGPLAAPRLDFAVRVSGPLVQQAANAMTVLWLRIEALRRLKERQVGAAMETLRDAATRAHRRAGQSGAVSGSSGESAKSAVRGLGHAEPPAVPRHHRNAVRAALLLRDNLRYRTDIERAYRKAIARAQHDIIIANAYFVPGRKMRTALILAAQRGVKVQLLVQGRYEYFMQYYASRPVYAALLAAGVQVVEYSASFLHAKVAVIDGCWATVGSSNIDPLSLLLTREANVVIDDPAFGAHLRARLHTHIRGSGKPMDPLLYANRPLGERVMERLALGLMRVALFIIGKRYF